VKRSDRILNFEVCLVDLLVVLFFAVIIIDG